MPGQERIERMLRDVWQRCRVRFEQALRPFEIALGECLNELFRDSTDWPARWAAFVAEWHARGVLISEPSRRAIEELLDLVARQHPIPRDPSGRYFAPTAAAPTTAPPPSNATSPNWPALTEPQRERIRRESEIPWWYPVQPRVPGDASYEKVLEAKGRAARDRLLAFFQSLEALGARADADDGNTDDGIDAIEGHIRHVHDAYDAYIAAYITLQQHALHYLETRPFLGMFIAGLDEQQVRKGLLLLDAVPMLMNVRSIKVERARSALSTKASVPATTPTGTPNHPGRLDAPSKPAAPPSVPTTPRDHRTADGLADSTPDLSRGKIVEPVVRPATE